MKEKIDSLIVHYNRGGCTVDEFCDGVREIVEEYEKTPITENLSG
jgi:hypothetical protein